MSCDHVQVIFLFVHVIVTLGTVTSFKYLGAVVSDDGSKPEVLSRIAQATAALTKLKPIWRDNNISLGSKEAMRQFRSRSEIFFKLYHILGVKLVLTNIILSTIYQINN